jgi:hypothetical protein
MAARKTPKPATALDGEPASKFVGFAGRNDTNIAETSTDLQARRLCRLYAVSFDMAVTVATLAYGVAR